MYKCIRVLSNVGVNYMHKHNVNISIKLQFHIMAPVSNFLTNEFLEMGVEMV